jgi:hypothetical protein
MSQPTSVPIAQIPIDALQSLIASVDALQNEVAELRKDRVGETCPDQSTAVEVIAKQGTIFERFTNSPQRFESQFVSTLWSCITQMTPVL